MIVICQICRTDIAETEPEKLALPLTGNMFSPHRTGFPKPFMAFDWVDLRCRYCNKRPFLKEDEIYTHEGIYDVKAECLAKDKVRHLAISEDIKDGETIVVEGIEAIKEVEAIEESRDTKISRLKSEGKSNKEIADILGVSPSRVSQIIKSLEE
jgi:hypothetical protein